MAAETTLCTCVEAGPLEAQAVLLAESLRRFAGRYSDLPFVAVKPRRGPALSSETKRAFRRLDVELVEDPRLNGELWWWDHANKTAAIRYTEDHASSDCVTWMDSDMMFLDEPTGFAPTPGTSFIGKPGEAWDLASNGSDEQAEYWRQLCARLGLDFAAFPDVVSWPDEKRIKAYFQGGLFTYHRDVRFGRKHHEVYKAMLEGDIISKFAGIYHQDQVSVALTVQALGLKHSEYDPRMNFNYNYLDEKTSALIPLTEVKILHYHGSFYKEGFDWAMRGLQVLPADRVELIRRYAPFNTGGMLAKAQRKLYAMPRKRKVEEFRQRGVAY